MLSVVFRGDLSQLSSVRAVAAGYPLRGQVTVSTQVFGAGQAADGRAGTRSKSGRSAKLLATMGAAVGDEVAIGAATFRIARVLITRPDQGYSFADLAPSAADQRGRTWPGPEAAAAGQSRELRAAVRG